MTVQKTIKSKKADPADIETVQILQMILGMTVKAVKCEREEVMKTIAENY